ncbi:MAG: hypothetical protein GXO15_00770 [Crenarchaeota archaeon]|nr:hypothetical protein [Thermoproteota archaeon]
MDMKSLAQGAALGLALGLLVALIIYYSYDRTLATVLRERDDLRQQLSDCQGRLQAAEARVAEVSGQLDLARQQIRELKDRLGTLEARLAACNETLERVKAERDSLLARLEEANKTIEALNATAARLRAQVESLLQANELLRRQLNQSAVEKLQLLAELNETRRRLEHLQEQLALLNAELGRLGEELELLRNAVREAGYWHLHASNRTQLLSWLDSVMTASEQAAALHNLTRPDIYRVYDMIVRGFSLYPDQLARIATENATIIGIWESLMLPNETAILQGGGSLDLALLAYAALPGTPRALVIAYYNGTPVAAGVVVETRLGSYRGYHVYDPGHGILDGLIASLNVSGTPVPAMAVNSRVKQHLLETGAANVVLVDPVNGAVLPAGAYPPSTASAAAALAAWAVTMGLDPEMVVYEIHLPGVHVAAQGAAAAGAAVEQLFLGAAGGSQG